VDAVVVADLRPRLRDPEDDGPGPADGDDAGLAGERPDVRDDRVAHQPYPVRESRAGQHPFEPLRGPRRLETRDAGRERDHVPGVAVGVREGGAHDLAEPFVDDGLVGELEAGPVPFGGPENVPVESGDDGPRPRPAAVQSDDYVTGHSGGLLGRTA
jgi:hypothetical protein